MNSSLAKKIGATLGLTAGAIVLSFIEDAVTEKKTRKKTSKKQTAGGTIEEVFQQGALLPTSVADDLMLPINLSSQPRTTEPVVVNGVIDTPEQLYTIITDMVLERAQMAYENMLVLVEEEGYDLANASERDEAVRRTLMVVAPSVDWSAGLAPYTFDSPEGLIWRSTEMLGEMAHQSFWNKQTALGA